MDKTCLSIEKLDFEPQVKKSEKLVLLESIPNKTSSFLQTQGSLRFSKKSLTTSLRESVNLFSLQPIESFEAELYKASQIWFTRLGGRSINLTSVEETHHLRSPHLAQSNGEIRKCYSLVVESLVEQNPLITTEYFVIERMIEVFNGLLVKWKIAKFNNYDYRFSGRCLNVPLLDLKNLNSGYFTLDILWFCLNIHKPFLGEIANSVIIELGILLREETEKCLKIFFNLNPKSIYSDYNIDKILAFTSKDFTAYYTDITPEPNLTSFSHAELKLKSWLVKCISPADPMLEKAQNSLIDLELVYRNFEKSLITSLLISHSRSKFFK